MIHLSDYIDGNGIIVFITQEEFTKAKESEIGLLLRKDYPLVYKSIAMEDEVARFMMFRILLLKTSV